MSIENIRLFSKKLKNLDTNTIIGYAYDNKEFLEELEGYNQSMLQDGKLSNSVFLPKYSINSQKIFGKPNIRIQLKDTGAFYKSITAKRDGNTAEITFSGQTQKDDIDLERKYTKHIFGTDKDDESDIEKLASEFILEGLENEINNK